MLDAGRLVDRYFQVPELVIEVPKFIIEDVPMRTSVPEPQLAEQLVEVPKTVSYSSLQRTFQFLVVEDQVLVFKVFPQDSVQQRRLPENAFLSGLWSRSLTLFLVEVFLVHLLLTLQLFRTMTRMSLVKGFFALFPKIKKVRRSLRTRGRNCLRTPAHPRRRLSWRSPSSGCGSGRNTLARRTSGTDVLTVQSGALQLVSRSCGTAKRMRREGAGTGTETRVSPRLTSLLFLLGEELYRQPRAVYKYWAGGLPSCDHAATCFLSSSSFMADMDQKDRCSCMYKAGIAGYYAPRAVFPSLVGRPHCSACRYGPEVQMQWHVQSWFFWRFSTSRCVA